MEARQFGRDHVADTDAVHAESIVEGACDRTASDRSGALADDVDRRSRADPLTDRIGQRHIGQAHLIAAVAVDDLAAQGSPKTRWRLRNLFEKEMRRITPVDISSRDTSAVDGEIVECDAIAVI